MAKKNNLIVGLDIGTSKICAVVGEMRERGIEVVGVGTHPSQGLRKGVVINIESTVDSIKKAIEEAELMAGCDINSVFTGIAGGHIKGFNSHGIVALKNREVTQRDVDRVIEAAKAVAIPMDREVLHILPQEYIIDDQDGIREPLGMSGVRLEAKVHIVTGAVTSAQNIIKCCNRTGLDVADIVLEPLASSFAVVSIDDLPTVAIAADIMECRVYHIAPEESLYHALSLFQKYNISSLPVIAPKHEIFLGMLERQDILTALDVYFETMRRQLFSEHQHIQLIESDDPLRLFRLNTLPKSRELIQKIPVPPAIVGQSLRSSNFRNDYRLEVMAIEAWEGGIIAPADPDYTLMKHDILVVIKKEPNSCA